MLEKEPLIISNFIKIKQEIKKIYSYIDTDNEFKKLSNDKERVIKLKIDHIERIISYDFQNQHKTPKIFSDFIVTLLFDFSFNDKNCINRKEVDNILTDWEKNPDSFWRFFYIFYIKNKEFKYIKNFLEQNEIIREKIISSMTNEFTAWLDKRSIEDFDKRHVHTFIRPFIYYSSLLYSNKCPHWLLQHDLTKLCFVSCWDFSSEYGVRISNDFSANSFENVYEWLINGFELTRDDILGVLKSNLGKLSNDWLKGQCLAFIL